MVKTNIIKTKKNRKISIFFLFFLQNTRTVLGDFYKKIFLANKKNFHEYMNAFIKNFFATTKKISRKNKDFPYRRKKYLVVPITFIYWKHHQNLYPIFAFF